MISKTNTTLTELQVIHHFSVKDNQLHGCRSDTLPANRKEPLIEEVYELCYQVESRCGKKRMSKMVSRDNLHLWARNLLRGM